MDEKPTEVVIEIPIPEENPKFEVRREGDGYVITATWQLVSCNLGITAPIRPPSPVRAR